MKKRTRISDVASLAGVSVATVSRTLSAPDTVKPETRERVYQAISELNYFMDGSARALASGRSYAIGIVVPALDDSIFALAVQGLQTRLAEAGYHLLIATHEYNMAVEQQQVRTLLETRIDAIIMVGAQHNDSTWDLIERSSTRLLVAWSKHERFPSIAFDNYRIGEMAAEHLIALEHTRFGLIALQRQTNDRTCQRTAGFIATLHRHCIEFSENYLIELPFGFASGRRGWEHLMAQPMPPTAIFCTNDVLAMGCLFEAQKQGQEVPRDVSIVGCSNLPVVSQLSPGLTTVNLPAYQLGMECARQLVAWIEKGIEPTSLCLDVDLVVRGSTGPPPQEMLLQA